MVNRIINQTPEQHAASIVKSVESRKRKSAERAASLLRRDFLDNPRWEELATSAHVTLPTWGDAPSPTIMRSFLRKIGVAVTDYLSWAGGAKLTDFAKANPAWPARAWAGLVLEWATPRQMAFDA